MLRIKINYICQLCKGLTFYIMPTDEKVKSGDTVSSNNKFLVECKKCRQKYLLKINLERI